MGVELVQTVASVAECVRGRLCGPGDVLIRGINTLETAGDEQLTLIGDGRHARRWSSSQAAAALVTQGVDVDASDGRSLIFVEDAEIAMISVLELFRPPDVLPDVGVHPQAWVHDEATVGADARIGPQVTVDRGCVIGSGVVLHAGVRLYAGVVIGDGSVVHGNCVIRERCQLGRNVILHQNVSIGADGFGYRPAPDGSGLLKVPHVGTVRIEDDVEIGAGSCIDRGKFEATVIGRGTKIDDLVLIGHNCLLGSHCIVAGHTGIAGSCELGDGVVVGGGVGVSDHIRIGAGAQLGARSGVTRDVPAGSVWLGYPADSYRDVLRQWSAIRRLPELISRFPESSAEGQRSTQD